MISCRMFFVPLIWSFVILFTFEAKLTATTPEAIKDSITKASLYLRTYGQEPDGSFSPQSGPAITALAAAALVRTGTSADSPISLSDADKDQLYDLIKES